MKQENPTNNNSYAQEPTNNRLGRLSAAEPEKAAPEAFNGFCGRYCARCGKEFRPKRRHQRFCTSYCRQTWNNERIKAALREYDGEKPGAMNSKRKPKPKPGDGGY